MSILTINSFFSLECDYKHKWMHHHYFKANKYQSSARYLYITEYNVNKIYFNNKNLQRKWFK